MPTDEKKDGKTRIQGWVTEELRDAVANRMSRTDTWGLLIEQRLREWIGWPQEGLPENEQELLKKWKQDEIGRGEGGRLPPGPRPKV